MSDQSRQRLAYLLVLITPAMWSANYIVARAAPDVIGPYLLAFSRWALALCLMLPFALPELRKKWPLWRAEWRSFIFLGALGMWICGAFVYIGGQTTEALNIGLLYAMAPVLIAVISALWFEDKLRGLQVLGFVLSLAGVLVILLQGKFIHLLQVEFNSGDLWILIAVLSWTLYSLTLRNTSSVLSVFSRLAVITLGGIVVLLPFTLYEIASIGLPGQPVRALVLVVVAAVLPGFGAYQAYSYLQQQLGASRASMVLYVSPLYTALIAWWLLAEVPRWFHLVGAFLILPGMYLAMRQKTTARSH